MTAGDAEHEDVNQASKFKTFPFGCKHVRPADLVVVKQPRRGWRQLPKNPAGAPTVWVALRFCVKMVAGALLGPIGAAGKHADLP